jgi:hypothetical protein
VIIRKDHVAGGLFVVAGILVIVVSQDLPFGTIASPGAGMLPMLCTGLMIFFGLILVLRAGDSPPFAEIAWDDLPHALVVVAAATAAIALYTVLGFVLTMSVLLFSLVFLVERRNVVLAACFSLGVTLFAYALFSTLLKSPLPRGPFGF